MALFDAHLLRSCCTRRSQKLFLHPEDFCFSLQSSDDVIISFEASKPPKRLGKYISQETSSAHSLNFVFVLVKTYLMVKKLNSAPGGADELPRRKAEQSKPVKKREIKFVFLFEYKFLICIFFLIAGCIWVILGG